jgi:HK97 gp10 family phage protein
MPRTVVTVVYNHFDEIARRLPEATRAVVVETALEIEAMAKVYVPVDTGTLKNSIQSAPESDTVMVVYTPMDYSIFVEWGTVNAPAQPYLTPAAEQARPRFMAAMRDLESRLG